jgi:hypothetical protein
MILDRQFHPQAKACLSICGDVPCLDTPSKRGDTLSEAGESEALSRVCASHMFSRIPVVGHLGMNCAVLTGESDEAVLRATMPDHIGHALAHRPGESRVRGWW